MRVENKIALIAVGVLALMATLQLGLERLLHGRSAYASAPAVSTNGPHTMASFGPHVELIVPVRGVRREALTDTWGQARSQGRTHQGIDILAPMGTPVIAAQDGTIARFFDSERGGVTIYEYDKSQRYVLYYAHLSSRQGGLREGDIVRQGDVIGYVGQTGNATTPHLHFEIERMGADLKWYHAEAMNPYPYLIAEHMPD